MLRSHITLGFLAVAILASSHGIASAAGRAPSSESFLKDILGITALEEENAAQQSQIDALQTLTGQLDVRSAQNEADIETLFECKEALEERIARLEAVVDCPDDGTGGFEICNIDGTNFCIDTDSSDDNCGACGNACAANEECVDGACQLLPCDPAGQCFDALLLMDGTCQQTPKPNDTPCDDGQGCTVADICQNGTCVGFGTPCGTGETCTEDGMGGFVCE